MKKIIIVSVALLALSLNSCRKDSFYNAPIVTPQTNLSFTTDIFPILTSHGCGCHITTWDPKMPNAATAFTNITTGNSNFGSNLPYIDTINPSSSPFYLSLTSNYPISSNFMPKNSSNKLTANELATVLAWIEQGANP